MGESAAQHGRGGFSLIELMIVLAVLAIVAALAVPMVAGAESTRLRSAARLLAADLETARHESMTHAADPRAVVFDTAANRYHIAPASALDTPIDHPASGGPYRVQLGQGRAHELAGVRLARVECGGDAVLGFGMFGELDQGSPATIVLATTQHEVTITVTPDTGEVSVSELMAR